MFHWFQLLSVIIWNDPLIQLKSVYMHFIPGIYVTNIMKLIDWAK